MDDDGFTVQGSSRGAKARQAGRERNLETFYRDTPRYPGTEAEFTRAHARAYGIEEGLGPDGSHPGSVNPHFPKDSAREAAHLGYKAVPTPQMKQKDAMTETMVLRELNLQE
jgi:hypothetical protein